MSLVIRFKNNDYGNHKMVPNSGQNEYFIQMLNNI